MSSNVTLCHIILVVLSASLDTPPLTQLSPMASSCYISRFSAYTLVPVPWLLRPLCRLLRHLPLQAVTQLGFLMACSCALFSFSSNIQCKYLFVPRASGATYTLLISKFTSPFQTPHPSSRHVHSTSYSTSLLGCLKGLSNKHACLCFSLPHPYWSSFRILVHGGI